jgi:hypothetical protein
MLPRADFQEGIAKASAANGAVNNPPLMLFLQYIVIAFR